MTADRFAVLVVCHANLCRSPLVERLLDHALSRRLGGFTVASAGTHAHEGLSMHPHTAAVLREWDADDTGFRSRPLTVEAVRRADLILAAERSQRAQCVSLLPEAVGRAFTLRQFGRLAAAVDPSTLTGATPADRLRALVSEANLARAEFQPVGPDEDDLVDPIGGPVEGFRACAQRVHDELVQVMVDRLATG
jgi:protein-tyrosine phosphatase